MAFNKEGVKLAVDFLNKASSDPRAAAMELLGWERSGDRGFCPEALALHEALNEGLLKTGEAGWSSKRKSDATAYSKMIEGIIKNKCIEVSEPEPDELRTDEELNAKLLSLGLSGYQDTLPDTSFEHQMDKDKKKLITRALLNTYLLKKRNQIIKESSNGLNAYLLMVYKFYIYALESLKDSKFTDKPEIFNGILANIDPKNVMRFFIPNHIINITGQEMSFPVTTDNNYYKCFEKIMEYKKGRGSKTEKLITFEDDITKFQQMVNDSLGENGYAVNISDRTEQKVVTSRQEETADRELSETSQRFDSNLKGLFSRKKGGAKKRKRNKTNRKKVIRSKHKKYKRTNKGKKNKKTKRR
jgi:hypothetical protein